jgi:hypothetical protein
MLFNSLPAKYFEGNAIQQLSLENLWYVHSTHINKQRGCWGFLGRGAPKVIHTISWTS